MADIEITGKDYSNLSIVYSDKNIIRNIEGQETLVEFNTNSNEFSQTTYTLPVFSDSNFDINSLIIDGRFATETNRKLPLISRVRVETGYLPFEFNVEMNDTIVDEEKISCKLKINYKQYSWVAPELPFNPTTESIRNAILYDDNNYYASDKLVFGIMKDMGRVQEKASDYIGNNSRGIKPPSTIIEVKRALKTSLLFTLVKKDDKYYLNVRGRQLVWNGYMNNVALNRFYLDIVDSVEFTFQYKGINSTEKNFKYVAENSQSFATDDPYELESNELMQYTIGQPQDEKISKITAEKIFDGTNINRQIVSFDLLNVQKYDFDNGDGTQTRRYLTSRDLIKIKDENDNWVGEYNDEEGNSVVPYFEIIQIENIWDGSFYKRITAKQVL